MTQYFGLDWLAMCLTFAAIYLLGNRSRAGFVVMMVGNLCWSAIGLWAGSYAMDSLQPSLLQLPPGDRRYGLGPRGHPYIGEARPIT